ncbi:MAG: uridine kinase [Pyrinomonadaceae bacterium]
MARSPRDGRAALLVGVSGTDASGKGYITKELAELLARRQKKVAVIGADGWLNLPAVRFDPADPAWTFYTRGFRFEDMFRQLVLPLCERGSIDLKAELAEETAGAFHTHRYSFEDVQIVLVEGIFVYKKDYAKLFDLRIWIECSTETALKRAVARSQEGLPPAQTIRAYETIYFPAQRIHAERDDPRGAADLIMVNE